MTCVVSSPHSIWPQAQWGFAQELDAADFATEEPPQEENDEDSFEEEEAGHSGNANDSVCIQCDDGGTLMTAHTTQPLRVLLATFCSAHACASSSQLLPEVLLSCDQGLVPAPPAA